MSGSIPRNRIYIEGGDEQLPVRSRRLASPRDVTSRIGWSRGCTSKESVSKVRLDL